MITSKFIGKLLKLKGLFVTGFAFKKEGDLEIAGKPYKNGCRCQQCGRRSKIVRTCPEPRRWWDIPVTGRTIWLLYYPREICCPTHGRCSHCKGNIDNIEWLTLINPPDAMKSVT